MQDLTLSPASQFKPGSVVVALNGDDATNAKALLVAWSLAIFGAGAFTGYWLRGRKKR